MKAEKMGEKLLDVLEGVPGLDRPCNGVPGREGGGLAAYGRAILMIWNAEKRACVV